MIEKISDVEYEELGVETRIFGEQKPTVLLFIDDDTDDMTEHMLLNKNEWYSADGAEVKCYMIDINTSPILAAEYHVGPSDTTDPRLTPAPVLILNLNTLDGKNLEVRRFAWQEGFKPIYDFVYAFKVNHRPIRNEEEDNTDGTENN